MLLEIVRFNLGVGIDRAKVTELYRRTAPAWAANPDLVEKYYFHDAATDRGGGVYLWKSRAAAERWHGADYRDMVRDTYGAVPTIEMFDALLHVDAIAGTVEALT
jgi:hypothetical protein